MKVYTLEYSYEQWLKQGDKWEWGGSVHSSLESAQNHAAEDARKSLVWEKQDKLLCGENWIALAYDYNHKVYRVVETELQD